MHAHKNAHTYISNTLTFKTLKILVKVIFNQINNKHK